MEKPKRKNKKSTLITGFTVTLVIFFPSQTLRICKYIDISIVLPFHCNSSYRIQSTMAQIVKNEENQIILIAEKITKIPSSKVPTLGQGFIN